MRTVLIVGGSHTLPDRESTMLERSDVGVLAVAAASAAQIAAERGADLVIADPEAEGVDAASLCAALRARGRPGMSVLLVAAPTAQARYAGVVCDGFVSRPLTTARLLDAIRRHAPIAERGEARAAFASKVDFERKGAGASGYAHDLTSGGMFLVTREPLVQGEEIDVAFALPKSEPHAVRARARVVRRGDAGAPAHHVGGFGLAFVNLAPEHHVEIARWLRQKAAP